MSPTRKAAPKTAAAKKAVAKEAVAKEAVAKKAAPKKVAPKKAASKATAKKAPARRSRARSGPAAAGLLVTPGASADRDNRTLVALEEGLSVPVERITIRSRAARKVHEQLRDDMGDFADRLGVESSELVIGGRSFGGRMCSMLVAAGEPVAGLVLLSYPLHPPGKPDDLRVEHFADITVPTLFVSGTNDPFASPEELEEHASAIAGPVDFVWLDGEPHAPRNDAAVVAAVAGWIRAT